MSTTETLTLSEFLLARIAEDEADAQSTQRDIDKWHREREATGHADGSQGSITLTGIFGTACDPARVRVECEAKRRILEEADAADRVEDAYSPHPPEMHGYMIERLLALPYGDHPDYREEWRP